MTRKQIAKRGDISLLYKHQRARHADVSFYMLIAVIGITSFVSVLLLLFGDASAAAATTASGLTSGAVACSLKLYQDANNRLDDVNDSPHKEDDEHN